LKEWFTVGELSGLFNLNVQTLHYYDSIGLFSPMRTRGAKGERLYQFDQIYKLASIRFLKKLGYSLRRIKDSLTARDADSALAELRGQSAELRRRSEELARLSEAIDRKLRLIEDKTASLDPASVELKAFPARRFIPLGLEESLYRNDDFYFYPTVVFYRDKSKSFGAMLSDDFVGEPGGPEPLGIPAGDFVVGYHRGPYERIEESFARIRAASAELGVEAAMESINVNIIDQFVESDSGRYITEVQMRARRRPS
jgi:DNA-binding transcriptional MerR regulator/effector-binding domain-containing protein